MQEAKGKGEQWKARAGPERKETGNNKISNFHPSNSFISSHYL